MSDQQVKEFFASVLEGGPADRLDLDRAVDAGRRRRRIRTATTVGSAAAVLVLVGALVVSALPRADRSDLGGATLSPTPSASASDAPAIIAGSAEDWARALEPFLPAGTETPAMHAGEGALQSYPSHAFSRASFRLVKDGRATALVVTAYADVPEQRGQSEVVAARIAELEQSCGGTEIRCDPRIESSSGPVIVRRWADGSHIAASSVRDTGIVVTVDSWNGDASGDKILDGSGDPGLLDDVDALVTLAASVPVPASVMTTPTPTPTPVASTDAPTTGPTPSPTMSGAPQPSPTSSAPTPQPTSSWSPKPAGLIGTAADAPCEQTFMPSYRAQAQITVDVLQYVLCPSVVQNQTYAPGTLVLQPGDDGFAALDSALREADVVVGVAGCTFEAWVMRPIYVETAEGTYLVNVPVDNCGKPLRSVREAIVAIAGSR